MKNRHAQNRLLLLVVVSACVHALLLYSPGHKVELASQQGSSFAVRLQTIYPKPQQNTVVRPEKKAVTKKATKQVARKSPAKEQAAPDNKQATQQTTTTESITSSDSVRTTLLAQIKTEFTQHFSYPRVAQRKGWQGKVLLGFNINRQGNISDIHIKNSSGYAVLDQAAQNSLSQVKKIQVTEWPFKIKQAFNLPIIYKLYEG